MKEKDEQLQSEVNKGFNKFKKSTDDEINANDTSGDLFSAAARDIFVIRTVCLTAASIRSASLSTALFSLVLSISK